MTHLSPCSFAGPGRRLFLCLALACTSPVTVMARADPINLSVTYYTLTSGDPDTQGVVDGPVSNEVQAHLGPDGLPVLNTTAFGCTSNCYTAKTIHDVNGSGELTYWSPGLNSHVIPTGSGTATLPYAATDLFPPNGTGHNDSNNFQTAVFSTLLHVPITEAITFTAAADDDAFVFLDGTLVCDIGGVHTAVPGDCSSDPLSAGNHSLEIFYADLHSTQAVLDFSIDTAGITQGVTPEPPSALLLASALLGLGALRLRQKDVRST